MIRRLQRDQIVGVMLLLAAYFLAQCLLGNRTVVQPPSQTDHVGGR